MARTQHRIRKHDMKEDSFVTFAFRAQEYIQQNQRPFIIGLVAIVGVTVGTWMFSGAGQRAELNAEQALGQAFIRVQQNDMLGAAASYEHVISDFSGTAGAREALFYLANLHFVQQEWPQAIERYEQYVREYAGFDPGRTGAALSAVGDAFQALEDHERALTYYERVLNTEGTDYLKTEALMAAARSALALGDFERATGYADLMFEIAGNAPVMTRMRELLAYHGVRYLRGF